MNPRRIVAAVAALAIGFGVSVGTLRRPPPWQEVSRRRVRRLAGAEVFPPCRPSTPSRRRRPCRRKAGPGFWRRRPCSGRPREILHVAVIDEGSTTIAEEVVRQPTVGVVLSGRHGCSTKNYTHSDPLNSQQQRLPAS